MPKRKSPTPVYITSLELENVRCFGDRQPLDLTIGDGRPARWTLILGDNGLGKTTLLQCLAWMRLVPSGEDPKLLEEENELLESILKQGPNRDLALSARFTVGVPLSSGDGKGDTQAGRSKMASTSVKLFFDAKRHLFRSVPTANGGTSLHDPLMVVYGANRLLGVQNLTRLDLDDPVDPTRLSSRTELYDVEELLGGLDYAATKKSGADSRERKQLNRLMAVLAKILPRASKTSNIRIVPPKAFDRIWKPSTVHFKNFSGLIPLSAMSLGYQTVVAWTTDLAWRMIQHYPESPNPTAEPAIVLIDEIDLHLHPRWQLDILDDLSEVFPGTQFIATAHSPLMVQVAEGANLALLSQQESDVMIVNDPDVVRSWRVDQILTSELFKIPRTRDAQTERIIARRDQLVQKRSRSAAEEAELDILRAKIADLPTAQDQVVEEVMMDFIRRTEDLIAKQKTRR